MSLWLRRAARTIVLATLILLPVAVKAAPIAADQAFALAAARSDGGDVRLRWTPAPGTYLYRDRLSVRFEGRDLTLVTPPGEVKDDATFGVVQVYHGAVEGHVAGLPARGRLDVTYQGCATDGICYPPQHRVVDLASLAVSKAPLDAGMPPAGAPITAVAKASDSFQPLPTTMSAPAVSADTAAASAMSGGILPMLAAFLGFGALLAFTPCVFPMIPILVAMLAGGGRPLSPGRGLALTLTYVLAMAAAYGLVGLAAGWSGANLQALLQTPLALGTAAALFGALALAMFGAFDLALPATRALGLGGGRAGSLPGAALLGFGSALIVGPCVTPPLAAAMLYAIQSGDAARGGLALFALGLGMGLPLIAVGVFGPRVLPRSGPWLARARPLFGAVFLGVAALLVARLLDGAALLGFWGVTSMGVGVFLGGFDRLAPQSPWGARIAKTAGLVAAIWSATLLVGAAGGSDDPLRPLAFAARPVPVSETARARRASSLAAFEAAMRQAGEVGRPVLVSFTADWCAICKANEREMAAPDLRDRLERLPVVVADLTAQTAEQRSLMSRFSVVGPPVLFIADAAGREIPGTRIIGPVSVATLDASLRAAGQ